jgi:hypothetical protein
MDTRTSSSTPPPALSTRTRPKRGNGDDAGVRRYFLPKSGSSPATPELGQEVASEGEALIQAFRSAQPFYTLTAWKAVPEVNGAGSPMIVKQALAPKQVQS